MSELESEEEIKAALAEMEIGDILTFANGAIATRTKDDWEITLPGPDEEMSDDRAQEIYDALAEDSAADAEAHPQDYRPTLDQHFRRFLRGE